MCDYTHVCIVHVCYVCVAVCIVHVCYMYTCMHVYSCMYSTCVRNFVTKVSKYCVESTGCMYKMTINRQQQKQYL